MRADRRDNNEAEFVGLWHSLGYVWIPMKPGQGFDGLLITPREIMIVEIKNSEHAWKLTRKEQAMKAEVERLGHKYHICDDIEYARYLAGVI